ncbi:MAG: cytochrome P450, partial [Caulobacteraceae bacterium]
MDDGSIDVKRAAREAVYAMPLADINPADPEPFRNDTWAPYFERLRAEDPVHWAESPEEDIGGYWSITKFDDIVAVDSDHQSFSSEPAIVL